MLNKKIIYVSGLPRSGSTLLCQLLGQHPEVGSNMHSSPLSGFIHNIRQNATTSDFFLSQLDVNFDNCYEQLLQANIGFMNGWFSPYQEDIVVDKNRAWLNMSETLKLIDPNFKMIVCLRDLRQIFGSIEAQHKKTRLINFSANSDANSSFSRYKEFYAENGVVGFPLKTLQNMQDIDDMDIRGRILYLCYESLAANPEKVMAQIYEWCELPEYTIDYNNLINGPYESDSYYRMKFSHKTRTSFQPSPAHTISPRIDSTLLEDFKWYYEQFYPQILQQKEVENTPQEN